MVDAQTDAFVKDIQKMMRAAGYKYKRRLASAQEEMRWTHPDGSHVSLCGWHGKGNWGTGRALHSLYDTHKEVVVISRVGIDFDAYCRFIPRSQEFYTQQLHEVKRYLTNLIQTKP